MIDGQPLDQDRQAAQINQRLQNSISSRRGAMAVAMKLSDELVEDAKP
jgi:hypothetical protein